jgi:hypothetical protein
MNEDRAIKLQELWFAICRNGSYTTSERISFIKRMNHTFTHSKILNVHPWTRRPLINMEEKREEEELQAKEASDIKMPTNKEELARWRETWDVFVADWDAINDEYEEEDPSVTQKANVELEEYKKEEAELLEKTKQKQQYLRQKHRDRKKKATQKA